MVRVSVGTDVDCVRLDTASKKWLELFLSFSLLQASTLSLLQVRQSKYSEICHPEPLPVASPSTHTTTCLQPCPMEHTNKFSYSNMRSICSTQKILEKYIYNLRFNC